MRYTKWISKLVCVLALTVGSVATTVEESSAYAIPSQPIEPPDVSIGECRGSAGVTLGTFYGAYTLVEGDTTAGPVCVFRLISYQTDLIST